MQQAIHVLERLQGRPGMPRMTVWLAAAAVLVTVVGAVALAAEAGGPPSHHPPDRLVLRTRADLPAATVVSGSPEAVSAGLARALFASAPAVIVADGSSTTATAAAAVIAERVHAPVLLAPTAQPTLATSGALRSEVGALRPRKVLVVGVSAGSLAALLRGVRVVTKQSELSVATATGNLAHVVVLMHKAGQEVSTTATAMAEIAGARVLRSGYNPQAAPAAIRVLAAARPVRVVAIGAGFRPARRLAARVAVAQTGVQLPGGGQILFPMRKIVALYGSPGIPALGVLGHQGLAASIARAKAVAARYHSLTRVPVIPAFEIIATIAQGSAGPTGSFSAVTKPAALRPWINAATAAGMYVILDLQPGRASLLAQAKIYQALLRRPNVGLALDPEWKLQAGQLPLHQIGSVHIAEVNSVVRWLAALTARYHLPQKLLELHQFRLSMIQDEARLDTRHSDLAIVINMDGQGAPVTKAQTWAAVKGAAPRGVYLGWKDFYVKDRPMLGPLLTIRRSPVPVLISYQ